MHYDCLEIGCCDYETLVGDPNSGATGISVEPIPLYCCRLPDRPGWHKLQAAVMPQAGSAVIHFVARGDVTAYQMLDYIAGCARIGSRHPGVAEYLKQRNLEHLWQMEIVPCVTFQELVNHYAITSLGRVKIDTEGCDCAILYDMLDCGLLPWHLQFESNEQNDPQDVQHALERLATLSYRLIEGGGDSILVREVREPAPPRTRDTGSLRAHRLTRLMRR